MSSYAPGCERLDGGCVSFWIATVLLAAALTSPDLSSAKSGDAQRPLHVEADTAELDETTNVGIYRGNVRITQGSMVLTADEVTVIAPDRELQKLIAQSAGSDGKSTFRQLTDAGDEITARARRMEYEPAQSQITLLGDAVLHRSANRFAAERIVYDIDRQLVEADDPQGKERIEMTLVPENRDAPEGP
jgi:lipopolysaccharide export system protein LptA